MKDNKVYDNQFISVDISIFTIINNKLNIFLVKRSEEPYKDYWSLVGGKVYNYESCEEAVTREIEEKIGIKNIVPTLSGVFSRPDRDIRFRNISISYYCLINHEEFLTKLNPAKVSDANWFETSNLPLLAFDHNEILNLSVDSLRQKVYDIEFIRPCLPKEFTLAQLQQIYENILACRLDKRNFRRKIASLNCIESTGNKNQNDSHKKSEIYTLKNN